MSEMNDKNNVLNKNLIIFFLLCLKLRPTPKCRVITPVNGR